MDEVHVDVDDGDEVSGIIDNVNSGELLVFPSGRFTWTSKATVLVDDWGIRCQDDTVFEVPEGWGDGDRGILLTTGPQQAQTADNWYIENVSFDSPGRAAPQILAGCRTAAHVNGIHYMMDGPLSHQLHGFGFAAAVDDPSGELRIEDYRQFNNGDISGYGGGNARAAVFALNHHAGTLRLVNPVLQGFPNNACYVARAAGKVIVEGGLLINNNVSAVRVDGGVEVYDTTVVIDTDEYVKGSGVLGDGPHNTRGMWGDYDGNPEAEPGGLVSGCSFILNNYRRCTGLIAADSPNMAIENCQFLLNDTINGAISTIDDSQTVITSKFDGTAIDSSLGRIDGPGEFTGSDNAKYADFVDGGIPIASTSGYKFDWSRTHSETPGRPSSSGDDGSGPTRGDGSSYDHTLSVESAVDTYWMEYSFTASGEIGRGDDVDAGDVVTENDDGTWTATGGVGGGGVDSFTFNGTVEEWSAADDEGAYTVYIDGTEATHLYESAPTMFEVVSTDTDASLEYIFDVEGTVEKADAGGGNSSVGEANDTITDNGDGTVTVEGKTGNGYGDAFLMDGQILSFEKTAGGSGVELLLDGTDVTDQYVAVETSSTFEIVSTDSGAHLEYSFDVEGTVEKADAGGGNSSVGEANDTITDNGDGTVTVEGKTGNGYGDAYLVTGSISNFERTGGNSDFRLLSDGTDVTENFAPGPQRVYIDGTTAPEEVNAYRIEVTDEIQPDPENTTLVDGGLAWDSLEDQTNGSEVVGIVGNGVDVYVYTGEIVDLTVDGNAATRVEN